MEFLRIILLILMRKRHAKIILNNANERYILCDNSKFDRDAFYRFYNLEDVTAVITDDKIDPNIKDKYSQYVKIIN